MGSPVAYLRRSRVEAGRPGAVSHEEQERMVRALAKAAGYTLQPGDILEDWGRSGGAGKEGQRDGYQELRRRVETGAVSDIFAYNLARLTRSGVEWAGLAAACAEHGVVVHFPDQTFDFRGVNGRMVASILAAVAQAERERAQEAGVATINHRRDRGDRLGPPRYGTGPGEDATLVVDIFRQTGTFRATAIRLDALGIPPKHAGLTPIGRGPARATHRPYRRDGEKKPPQWRASTVKAIIAREAPEILPRNTRRGSGAIAHHPLAGLLRCHCGGLLTGVARRGEITLYRCGASQTSATHGTPKSVSENAILPWVRDEVAHLDLGGDAASTTADTATRADLAARLERAGYAYIAGAISREQLDAEKEIVEAEMDKLAEAAAIREIPPAVWDGPDAWTPEDLNRWLRAILVNVQLGPDLRPVSALWRNPALRRP